MQDMRDGVVGPGLASHNYVHPDSQTRGEPLSVPPNPCQNTGLQHRSLIYWTLRRLELVEGAYDNYGRSVLISLFIQTLPANCVWASRFEGVWLVVVVVVVVDRVRIS